MELRQLKTFQTIATLMSFHGAAKVLGYAQSTVSAQIQGLEEDLGTQVFERVGRSIRLTPAGERLLEYARKMGELEREARARIGGGEAQQQKLRLGLSESFCKSYLNEILKNFFELYTGMNIQIHTCSQQLSPEKLSGGDLDLAIVLGDPPGSSALASTVLDSVPLLLAGRRKVRLAGQLLTTDRDLEAQTLLLHTGDASARAVRAALLKRAVAPQRILEVESLATLLPLVSAGLGVAFLPRFLAREEERAGRLSLLDWEGGTPMVQMHLVQARDARLGEPAKAFLKRTRQVLAGGDGTPKDEAERTIPAPPSFLTKE